MANYMDKINKIKERDNSRIKKGSSKNEINFTTGFEHLMDMRAKVVSGKLSQEKSKLLPEDIETIEQFQYCLEHNSIEDFEWGLDKKTKLHLIVKLPNVLEANMFMVSFRMWQDERAKSGLTDIQSVHGRLSGVKNSAY
jgi:hypothetical protein